MGNSGPTSCVWVIASSLVGPHECHVSFQWAKGTMGEDGVIANSGITACMWVIMALLALC